MTVYDPVLGASVGGGSTITLTVPVETTQNPSGTGDKLIAFIGFGNSAGATPAAPAGWTLIDAVYGGAGSWGSETGPRGVAAYHRTTAASESGSTVVFNNGGSGTDRAMRGFILRYSKSGTTWETIVSAKGSDSSVGTAFSCATGTNPGTAVGDQVAAAACWIPSTSTSSGTATCFNWTGAGITGLLGPTGPVANGNKLRVNGFYGSPTGSASGNLTFQLTLSDAASAGSALVVRLRDSGTPPHANAGSDQTGAEPWSTMYLDGSESTGNIASFAWTQTAGTAVTLTGSTTVAPSFTVPAKVGGETLTFSLTVTDTNSVTSAADTVNIEVLPPTEYGTQGGVLVPLRLQGE